MDTYSQYKHPDIYNSEIYNKVKSVDKYTVIDKFVDSPLYKLYMRLIKEKFLDKSVIEDMINEHFKRYGDINFEFYVIDEDGNKLCKIIKYISHTVILKHISNDNMICKLKEIQNDNYWYDLENGYLARYACGYVYIKTNDVC